MAAALGTGRNTFAYSLDGRRVPSVTEILRLAGLVDLSGIPEHRLEVARERGKDVHSYVEGLVRGDLDDELVPDPRIAPYIEAWRRFRDETGFGPEAAEVRVLNRRYGYAGTIDLLGGMSGSAWLLDLKATYAVPPEAALQTAGYRMAEGTGRRRGVLHLRANGTYALVEYRDHVADEAAFVGALHVALWKLRAGLARLED